VAARPDPIRIVEAAYAWDPDESAWLDHLVESTSAYDVGGGVIGYTVQLGARTEVTAMRKTRNAADREMTALREITSAFTPELARQVLAPTEFVGNCAYRLTRIARAATGETASTARTSAVRLPQMWALIAGDVGQRAVLLCFPRHVDHVLDAREPFPHAQARSLGMVGAHLSSALRLRSLARPTADDTEVEAVMTPRGKLLHANGAAKTTRGRESLARALIASLAARGSLRRADPDEAVREWTALVQGRWTIVETVERDGKRLVLARRNRLQTTGLLELTDDERDVAWLAALGHSYKYIAYELGHPVGTVTGRLRRAMRKLRVKSRAELLQKLGVARAK
jgi:DNA-binding CsgD family transcriptional regulator